MHNIMLDLETLGTGPNAAVIAIGACFFDIETREIGATFYRVLDLDGVVRSGGEMKMLRITGCKDSSMWYAGMVGKLVPFVKVWPEAYASREPAGYINRVEFDDAEIVEIQGTEAGD